MCIVQKGSDTVRQSFNPLRRCHTFLAKRGFYPVLLASVFSCAITVGRVRMTGSFEYVFLIRNLFLAWIPFGFSLIAAALYMRYPRQWWLVLPPGVLWLLFFPNAPYILTDMMHLWRIPPSVWWYDLGMVASFALSGYFLAVLSLRVMQHLVGAYLGRGASWLFVFGAIGLSGLGVYLGRFVRMNSWDLLFSPRAGLRLAASSIFDRENQVRAFGVSGMFAALLLFCYLTFVTFHQPDPVDA